MEKDLHEHRKFYHQLQQISLSNQKFRNYFEKIYYENL